MAKLTFMGGIHPYDGKDLSKDKPMKAVRQRVTWYIRCPSISVRLQCLSWQRETMY